MMSGVFEKYPNLKVILGHLGEGIPFFVRRIDFVFLRTPEAVPRLKRRPSEYFLSNFYVDTAGVFHEPSLQCTYETMGSTKIVFGSDYPMEDAAKGVEFVSRSRISEEDRERIFWKNSTELMA
jgi:predicted TIM-barrel fold metal-dependent hydrolase